MAPDDVDDAFADFESKVAGKEKKKPVKKEKERSEEDIIKKKYREEKEALKKKYRKEIAVVQAKKTHQAIKKGKMHPHQFKIERIAYIVVIVILLGYIAFDYGSSNPGTIEEKIQPETTQRTISETEVQDQETGQEQEAAGTEKTTAKEETEEEADTQTFSGRIDFVLNDIETEVVEEDLGYINSVTFIIQNDRDMTLTPRVTVYAFDDELGETWETRERGTYNLPAGIAPGKLEEASIDLSPKTFRNFHLEKTVRIELNDTEEGFIKAASKTITIS